jgi:hypothetical protein
MAVKATDDWNVDLRILDTAGTKFGRGDSVTSEQGKGKVLRIFGRAPKVAVRVDQLGPHASPLYFDCQEPEAFVYACADLQLITDGGRADG